jgi:hypothetical protein
MASAFETGANHAYSVRFNGHTRFPDRNARLCTGSGISGAAIDGSDKQAG